MDNHNSSKIYSIANLSDFKMEVISLLREIRSRIDVSTNKSKSYEASTSNKTAVKIGILKAHEFKMDSLLKILEAVEPGDWESLKKEAVKEFDESHKVINPTVKA